MNETYDTDEPTSVFDRLRAAYQPKGKLPVVRVGNGFLNVDFIHKVIDELEAYTKNAGVRKAFGEAAEMPPSMKLAATILLENAGVKL